jgi:hypothetical protein
VISVAFSLLLGLSLKNGFDYYYSASMVARRGYVGLAIFWKKGIDDKIKVMDEGNSRIQVTQIDTLFVLMIFHYGGKMYLSLDNLYLGLSYSLEGIF